MSYDSWTCLMVEKGPGVLTDEIRAVLKMAACELHLKQWDRMHIHSEVCEGVIETAWATKVVGARSGVLFRTQIDSEEGEYLVNFLLNDDDLERGAEFLRELREAGAAPTGVAEEPFPCRDLYRFYDLRETMRRAH